jgi:7,8-dihydroneopterin aldolase/epimerase/oxygenase
MNVALYRVEVFGYHGVHAHERRDGQRFLFDVELEVGEQAARTDRIEDAVDYRRIAEAVRELSDERAHHLLESLVVFVADGLLERFPSATAAGVRVHKPDITLDPPAEAAVVSVERRRP